MRSFLASGDGFTAAKVFHQHANTDVPRWVTMIYHPNNRNAYNQVTPLTHLNFNWGMLDVSSDSDSDSENLYRFPYNKWKISQTSMIQNTIDTHWEKYMCQIQYNLSVHQNICEMYFVWVPVQAIQEISRSPIEGLGAFLEKSRTTWHLCYYNLLNTSTVKSTLVYHNGQVEQWEQREQETHGGLWAPCLLYSTIFIKQSN